MIQFLRLFGMLSACMLALALPDEAQARWLRAETQRFIIYSAGSEQELRDYAAELEDFDTVLRHYHGIDQRIAPPRKLKIYMVRNNAELRRATEMDGDNLAGFYIAGEDDIFAAAIRDRSDESGDDTLFHEYTHHFISQYVTFPYPGWMTEGLAEFFATTRIRGTRISVGDFNKGRAYTLSNPWIPLDVVLSRQVRELNEDGRLLFYAEAWLLTHYMLSDPVRREKLEQYKLAIGRGEPSVKAMETVMGKDIKALQRDLEAYTHKGLTYTVLGRQKVADAPITITELPRSADDLLLENQKLMNYVSKKEQPILLGTIRDRAAKYAGDPFADMVLARAEIFYGDQAAGEAVLERHLAAHPDDPEALRLMAYSLIDTAEDEEDDDARRASLMEEARKRLIKANALQKGNYETFYLFARSRFFDADYPNDNTLDLLLLARKVAPQVDSISFRTAQALVIRKRFDEAEPMLTMLANDPHGGGLAQEAKTLLNQIASYTGKPN